MNLIDQWGVLKPSPANLELTNYCRQLEIEGSQMPTLSLIFPHLIPMFFGKRVD
jgi:hypothetical protein